MINIDIKSDERGVNPDAWFIGQFDTELLLTDFSRRLLKEVAKCEVFSENVVISDILGGIPPTSIGSGVKGVLYLMYGDTDRFGPINACWFGENTIPFIQEVSKTKDVNIILNRLFPLCDDEFNSVSVKILSTGKIYKQNLELYNAIIDER